MRSTLRIAVGDTEKRRAASRRKSETLPLHRSYSPAMVRASSLGATPVGQTAFRSGSGGAAMGSSTSSRRHVWSVVYGTPVARQKSSSRKHDHSF